MRNFLNKHKFIRVINFKSDKSSEITYHRREGFKPPYLINPNHIFISNGYTTIITTDKSPETINPLDFNSQYDVNAFTTAINSKIIAETFTTLKSNKIDYTMILLFGIAIINLVLLYFTLKANGVF